MFESVSNMHSIEFINNHPCVNNSNSLRSILQKNKTIGILVIINLANINQLVMYDT